MPVLPSCKMVSSRFLPFQSLLGGPVCSFKAMILASPFQWGQKAVPFKGAAMQERMRAKHGCATTAKEQRETKREQYISVIYIPSNLNLLVIVLNTPTPFPMSKRRKV